MGSILPTARTTPPAQHLSIPAIREELHKLADRGGATPQELRRLANTSFRRPAVRKARRKLPKLTAEKAIAIRAYAKANPDASQLEIAIALDTNQGRVSEAMNFLV